MTRNFIQTTIRIVIIVLLFSCIWKLSLSSVYAATLTSFTFDSFTSGGAKKAGVPFNVRITARDENSAVLTSFENSVVVTDSTSTIFPVSTTDFVSGVWSGSFSITEATTTGITVQYGGVQSSSSTFSVEADSRIKFLTITGGNNQSGTVNTQLSQALSVAVVDPYNNPIASQGVNFAINSYPPNAIGQTLGSSSGTSGSNGVVSTVFTLGRKTGTYIVRANLASGITTPVEFYETATPAVLLSLSVTPQVSVMPAGSYLAFTATGKDQYQNVRTLSSTTWSVQNGGGTIDSTGVFTAGSTIGTYLNTVRAVSGGVGGTATVTVIGEQIEGSESSSGSSSGSGSGSGSGESTSSSATATPTPTSSSGTLSDIIVDPSVITALQNAQIPIIAEAFDINGNSLANVNFTFEVSGNLGTLTQTSSNTVLLTASEVGVGTVTVTAQQGNIVRVAKVVGSVGTGLNRRLVIEDIESPQQVGQPFTISIAAKDTLNNFITDYEGPINLADTTGTIDPAVVQPNGDGVWFVQAIINLGHPEVSVTAAGDGMIGVSNIFEVQGEPQLSQIPPGGGSAGGAGAGAGAGDVLGASISGKIKELLQDKDLNKFTIARFIGAGLAAGIGILGASLGGGIMASRGLEALGRNPFAKGKLKFNLYLGIIAFIVAAGLAVFASFLIIQ